MKKYSWLFALLVAALLLIALSVGVFATDVEATPLTLDTTLNVQISELGQSVLLSFTPAQNGYYICTSNTDQDTYATLYDADMNELSYNDDGGIDTNFSLAYALEQGKTYYYSVSFLSEDVGVIPVTVSLCPIKSISAATATVLEYANGDWDEYYDEATETYKPYFNYFYLDNASYTVTFTDNSTLPAEGRYFEYQNTVYDLSSDDDQGAGEVWESGNTYTGTISAGGASCEIAVTVEKLPIKSLQLDPVLLIAGADGWTDTYWDSEKEEEVEYFCYDVSSALTGTATFTDNSTEPIYGGRFEYGDYTVWLNYEDDQGSGEVWTVGNTYDVTVTLGELSQTVPVTITSSPVKKLEVQPITVYRDVDAEENGESFGDPFLMYHWNDRLVLTATYTDDTSYTTQPGDRQVEYRGKLYEISYRQSQSSENLWQPGNTYTEEITVLGMTAPVSITVKENLIKSIQIDDITMTEDIDGYWETGWDEDAQEDVEYYAYNWAEAVDSLTVTFTDNTVFTGSLAEFEDTYNLSAARGDTQSAQTPWTVGNTYSCALLVGTHQAPLSVTIAPNPVESVSFEPVILPQTDEEYYWARHLQGTVTFRDGTKAQFDPNGFLYQDESHWIDWSDDQGDNPWSAGTHTASAYVMGKEFPVTVYIGEVKTSGDYSYVLYNGKAYICDSRTGKASLTLPTELDSYSVVGLLELGQDLNTVKDLTIPDTITHLDPNALWHDDYTGALDALTIGAGVKYFSAYTMYGCGVKEVSVSSSNANYSSTDGVVYNKNKTALVFYPWDKTDSHTVPNSVTDIRELVEERVNIADLDVTLGTGTKDQYLQEGDVVFTKDKKALVFCNSALSGSYTLPASVTKLYDGAFSHTALTSVTIHSGIRELSDHAFYSCTSLTEVVLPDSLDFLGWASFSDCSALKFFKIPQGVTELAHTTFSDSGLTTVVIPDTLEEICYNAFNNCPLTDVFYGGSEADWNGVLVYDDGNEPLLEATIHFDGKTVEGDLDGDYRKSTDDAVYLLLAVMFGTEDYPIAEGTDLDFNNDSKVDTDDAVYLLLNVMFGAEDYPI